MTDEQPTDEPSTFHRLTRALRPRATRAQVLAALLCGLLGFALVVQVRQTQGAELDSLRESDLIRILDDVSERTERLEDEAARLSAVRQELLTSSDSAQAAQEAAAERVEVLSILAGTAPATGPGVRLTISDADAELGAGVLLDAVQELRDSGAEAIQVDDVRVVASTSFVDTAEGIEVDGQVVESPYVYLAIGDPQTIATALDIPGGVLRSVRSQDGIAAVAELDEVTVDALRVPSEPEYARPAPVQTP